MLPTLPKLRMLNKLLALSGPVWLPVLMGARTRRRLERASTRIAAPFPLTLPPVFAAREHSSTIAVGEGAAGAPLREGVGEDRTLLDQSARCMPGIAGSNKCQVSSNWYGHLAW